MLKKFLVFALVVSCSIAIFAQDDYKSRWNAVYKLYRAKKNAEAMQAFVKLAESTSNSGNQYNCYIYAGYCARNLKKYDEAIAFADKASKVPNHYKYSALIRKMDFMYNAKKYTEMLDMFPADEIMKWPKYYRADALNYLGLAQYLLKKGEDAEKTFKLLHENAETDNHKCLALMRSGHNYRNQLKDTDKAMSAYRGAVEVPFSSGYKSEAYDGIALILSSQKKYDDALAEYDKLLAMKKISSYWAARGRYNKANLLVKMGKKEEAVKCYKQAIAVKGYNGWVKKSSKAQLKKLESK